MSAVPPTFATAAAFAFAATSPVSGVSGVCAGLAAGVVPGVVPVVAALAACARWPLPANATAAPTSATAASARAPPALLQSLFLMTSFQGGFPSPPIAAREPGSAMGITCECARLRDREDALHP